MLSGRIIEWNEDRGFGYLDSKGQRIFLHYRDFAEKYKSPEIGDEIVFQMGNDQKGRPCAKKAVHPREGGRFTSENIIFLSLLLIAPIAALVALSKTIPPAYLAVYSVLICTFTYGAYAMDKQRARGKKQREPEKLLHLLELIGGWPGAFVAQRYLRHKCTKAGYQLIFWLIVSLHQFVAIDYLREWKMTHRIKESLERTMGAK